MIPLVLTASEVLAYHAGTLTEIRRPVEPQPDPAVVRADIVGPWCHFEDEAGPPNERGNHEGRMWTERCPLGAPGDALFGQEPWAVHWMYDAVPSGRARSTHPDDNVWYQADGDDAPGSCGCPAKGRRGVWRPAETMPEWAARVRLVNRGVRVERADVWMWVVAVEVQK